MDEYLLNLNRKGSSADILTHLRMLMGTLGLGLILVAGVALSGTMRPAYAVTFACNAVDMDGSQEVPPVASAQGGGNATGTAFVRFDSDTRLMSWNITFSGLSGNATAAHFHGPATMNQTAPPVVNIGEISGLSSPMVGNTTLTEEHASYLLNGTMYVNIHTEANPDGEIRGQVVCTEEDIASSGPTEPTTPGGQQQNGNATDTTTTNTTADIEEWETATVEVGGEQFDIQYKIAGGTLHNMTIDAENTMLTAMITAEEDGELAIQLPREVIDSKDNGGDEDYIVYVDEIMDFADDDYGEEVRTLIIPFWAQAEQIDIMGTQVIPEFGAIAAIVLAVAIVGIIVATTKYGGGSGRFGSFMSRM